MDTDSPRYLVTRDPEAVAAWVAINGADAIVDSIDAVHAEWHEDGAIWCDGRPYGV